MRDESPLSLWAANHWPRGYETAVEGKNGFVCDVERSWMSPSPDDPEFWNFKQRAATCYNPQAAQFMLPFS